MSIPDKLFLCFCPLAKVSFFFAWSVGALLSSRVCGMNSLPNLGTGSLAVRFFIGTTSFGRDLLGLHILGSLLSTHQGESVIIQHGRKKNTPELIRDHERLQQQQQQRITEREET